MVDILLNTFASSNLSSVIAWLIVTYAATLCACIVDLICGVYKAKQANIARTSTGLRKTCTKAQHYFLPMLCLSFADFLAASLMPFPPFSMLWAAFCITCEFKSVLEKSHTKEEIREAANTMSVVIKNKEDIAQILVDILNQQKEQEKEKQQ